MAALGENSAEFAELAGEQALSVRAFAGEGVRVSIGEVEANTRFLSSVRTIQSGPGVPSANIAPRGRY